MLAVFAAVAFGVALLLHLIGHGAGSLVTTLTLAGLLLTALHLCVPVTVPWRRGPQA